MIRQHHHGIGLAALVQIVQYRCQYTRINPFYRRNFALNIGMMTALVRALQMNIYKVPAAL